MEQLFEPVAKQAKKTGKEGIPQEAWKSMLSTSGVCLGALGVAHLVKQWNECRVKVVSIVLGDMGLVGGLQTQLKRADFIQPKVAKHFVLQGAVAADCRGAVGGECNCDAKCD